MKAITKYLMMMLALLTMSVGFSSCEDEEPQVQEEIESGVVGRWSTSDGSVIFYFDKDGTGTWTYKEKDSNGNSVTTDLNFVYTYNENTGVLKLNIKGGSVIENYEVNLTGNTLMLSYYSDGKKYAYVLTR